MPVVNPTLKIDEGSANRDDVKCQKLSIGGEIVAQFVQFGVGHSDQRQTWRLTGVMRDWRGGPYPACAAAFAGAISKREAVCVFI